MKKNPTLRKNYPFPAQRLMVLRHLKHSPLTQAEALERYGIERLGARIGELREAGFPISHRIIACGKKRFAEYAMA